MTVHAVIAGGGTAGHVLPALALAEALVERGHSRDSLVYMGARRGIETRLVPPTGVPHYFFDVVGLQRSLRPSSWRSNASFPLKMLAARRRAIAIMRADRPAVVVSVGGYASLPAVLAARRLGVPVVVVSYDRTPGRSSRVTARFAAATATAFPGSTLPRARWTGAPVRAAVRRVDRERDRLSARRTLGVPVDRFMVAVIGGSLGSRVLNRAVLSLVGESSDDRSLAVYHVVGERFVDEHRAEGGDDRDGRDGAWYRVIGYEDRMADVYAACDVLVGRGGAGTVADVATTGVPSVLVPWSGAANDEQRANVAWLGDEGAAVVLDEDELNERLATVVGELRVDSARREGIGSRARALGEPNRRGAITDLIEEVAGVAR
ncbi:MAG: UDP-N-acetylglucosamine--N-acetylmuramyl-(pentapeptide) pyrophosphoryl-undecaprenol N-acetylglucosamine transferase [Acidimicrobiia bacterium]